MLYLQMFRYAIAAAESGFPSTTTYASSSFTRYRKGLAPVSSPDAFLPLTCPQIVSTARPNVFNRIARSMSLNCADPGSSIFAAIESFALFNTASDASAGRLGAVTAILVSDGVALATSTGARFFADRSPDFAFVTGLAFAIAGSGLNAAGFGSAGRSTATPPTQGVELQSSKYPCGGPNKPKPIKIPASTPMKSGPIRVPSRGRSSLCLTRSYFRAGALLVAQNR